MFFLILLALGVTQVVLALYARNVAISSAHEGARAAIEIGRGTADAEEIAHRTVNEAAGGLFHRLHVDTVVRERSGIVTARVRVRGSVRTVGPVPVLMPIDTTAVARGRGAEG
jgi:hypothetical protein